MESDVWQRDRVRFSLKKPGGGRASFQIIRDVLSPDGKRDQKAFPHPQIDALNSLLERKLRDVTTAGIEAENILKALRAEQERQSGAMTFNEENLKLLDGLWRSEYEGKQTTKESQRSAKNELLRAIAAIGQFSLISTPQRDLEALINGRFKGNRQRRIVSNLNHLLKFSGARFQLRPAPKERRRPKHLTPPEFVKVEANAPDEPKHIRLLFRVLFGTGARMGEAFAIQPQHVRGDVLHIEEQMDREFILRETKTREKRHTLIMAEYVSDVERWSEIPLEDRYELRLVDQADILRTVCQKVFPERPQKHLVAHDLRHSYAIWLLNKGVSLSLVAQSLGNSELVCQEYYSGFVLTPEGIGAIKAQLARADGKG